MSYESWAIRLDFHSVRLVDRIRSIYPTFFMRPMLREVKGRFNYPLNGLEIGVAEGYNAEVMLKCLNLKMLYLIDPVFLCEDRIIPFRNVIFYPRKAEDVVDHVPNNLDFIYIDGDHSYEGCKSDIELYWSKVRKGGIFGGHDFNSHYHGVAKAVLEFIEREGLELHGGQFDWWVIKGD